MGSGAVSAGMAKWQGNRFVSGRSRVRTPLPALFCFVGLFFLFFVLVVCGCSFVVFPLVCFDVCLLFAVGCCCCSLLVGCCCSLLLVVAGCFVVFFLLLAVKHTKTDDQRSFGEQTSMRKNEDDKNKKTKKKKKKKGNGTKKLPHVFDNSGI